MAGLTLRKKPLLQVTGYASLFLKICNLHSRSFKDLDMENEVQSSSTLRNNPNRTKLSPLLPSNGNSLQGLNIEVVDYELWRVSSGLAQAWTGQEKSSRTLEQVTHQLEKFKPKLDKDHSDFDDIEDMRLRGNLFYKLERDSREFEEYSFSFHRRKSSKSKEKPTQKTVLKKESDKKEKQQINSVKQNASVARPETIDNSVVETRKRTRTPTFNQLTGPYHEPFCLDIYISKSSVRACIVHRVTSKVVAVAHSISKDMKFDFGSMKNTSVCVAVGGILAQRAIADDIYNIVYTPRKGEKIEGKLKLVLQSIIDGGISVKLKIKQRRLVKGSHTHRNLQSSFCQGSHD